MCAATDRSMDPNIWSAFDATLSDIGLFNSQAMSLTTIKGHDHPHKKWHGRQRDWSKILVMCPNLWAKFRFRDGHGLPE